jgi:peptidoglycan/LPS O-acetylase OafA/YrhL
MQKETHFAGLDGLRGLAALAVLILHTTGPFGLMPLPNAGLAVDFFFALSGFVIAHAYEDRLLSGSMSFRAFLWARVRRLHPMIWLGLALGAAVYSVRHTLAGAELVQFVLAIAAGALLIPTNLISQPGYTGAQPLNTPAWSLFSEYAVNIFYAAFVRYLSNKMVAAILVFGAFLLCANSLVNHGFAGPEYADWPWGVARVIYPFFVGIALHRLDFTRFRGKVPISFWAPAVALVVVFVIPSNWIYEALAALVILPIIVAAGTVGSVGPRLTKLCLLVGRLSYPLYIIQYPLVRTLSGVIKSRNLEGWKLYLAIGVEIVLITAFAYAVLILLDEPIRRALGKRRPSVRQRDTSRSDRVV